MRGPGGPTRYGLVVLGYDCMRRDGSPATAVLLHPHPDMGGDRYHPVVEALYLGLPMTTLRLSFSSSDVTVARQDVVAGIELAPDPQILLLGYSFGADIAACVADPRVLGWFLVAPPLQVVDPAEMSVGVDPRPKRLAVPERDQFSSPERARQVTADWVATTVETIPDSDHFLVGRADAVLQAARAWLPSVVGAPG